MNTFKYISNWRYRYFVKKLKGIEYMIEDLVFKRYKTMYVREQIRQEYDQARSKLEILQTQLKNESEPGKLKETNLDEFKRLEDQEVLLKRDIDRKVAQMKDLDAEIKGAPATAESQGVQGINETLEALRELYVVTKQYLNELE